MSITLISYIILSLGSLQGLVLSSFLIFTKNNRTKGNIILGVVLCVFSLNMVMPAILYYFYQDFYHLLGIGFPLMFLFGPGLYFYTLIKTGLRSEFRIFDLVHILPFLMSFLISFPLYLQDAGSKILLIQEWRLGYLPDDILIGWAIECVHLSIYMAMSYSVLRQYKRGIKRTLSSFDRVNLSWLQYLVGFKSTIWLLYFVLLLAYFAGLDERSFNTTFLIFGISVSGLTYFIGYRGLKQPETFLPEGVNAMALVKYRNSGLNDRMIEIYLSQLKQLMVNQKSYKDPHLTLPQLAQKLDIPTNYLSQIINERLNFNFFDYVNSLRVNEAKGLLTKPENRDKTIIQLAFEVGFNSKSTFNTAFKKFAGETPTSFRSTSSLA